MLRARVMLPHTLDIVGLIYCTWRADIIIRRMAYITMVIYFSGRLSMGREKRCCNRLFLKF
jgi:hypothetical protein